MLDYSHLKFARVRHTRDSWRVGAVIVRLDVGVRKREVQAADDGHNIVRLVGESVGEDVAAAKHASVSISFRKYQANSVYVANSTVCWNKSCSKTINPVSIVEALPMMLSQFWRTCWGVIVPAWMSKSVKSIKPLVFASPENTAYNSAHLQCRTWR